MRIHAHNTGFTLIELSIVLVIIGLIVGGVLVGQDLIRAASVRAQVTQIEKYNTAVNTFRDKYGALPGDIAASSVSRFGFAVVPSRAGSAGLGDGNGVIEGNCCSGLLNDNLTQGETAWFWEDLSSNASLIEGSFRQATSTGNGSGPVAGLIPEAKIGAGFYIYVYSQSGTNYFGLSLVNSIDPNGAVNNGATLPSPGMTVLQAISIDSKIDDGFPQTGNVVATYQNFHQGGATWAASGGTGAIPGAAAAASSSTCYDNGGSSSNATRYSIAQSGGSNPNCGLSFRFQ